MRKITKVKLVKLLILLVGLCIAHLGVTLFILSDLGTDPFNVLIQGIFRTQDNLLEFSFLTHGRVHMMICFAIILVLLMVEKTYVKIGTIICMFCGGPIIDIFTFLLRNVLNANSSYGFRVLGIVSGCIILAFGMTIVIKSDSGTGPNDLVAVVISDKLKKKFSIIRILVDGLFVFVGFLLGGSVGIGTIICVGIVGPVAGIFLPLNEKAVEFILKKVC